MPSAFDQPSATNANKVAAIIVSYNDSAAVAHCAQSLQDQVEHIVLVDNGSDTKHQPALQALGANNNLTVLALPTNVGVGAAINAALETLDDAHFEWVLTMDQDSLAEREMVNTMLQAADQFPKAAFTPYIAGLGQIGADGKPVEVSYAITSGNLVPLAALRQLNGLAANLFIDGVDFDLSLRLRQEGYRIIRVPAARMTHVLGDMASGHREKRFYTNHSPLRRYYIARNMVLNIKRHAVRHPGFFGRLSLVAILSFIAVLIWGPRRRESTLMFARGIVDGIQGISGAYSHHENR